MSVTDDKQINSLIDKLNKCRSENKALKLSTEIFKTESEIKDIFKTENVAYKEKVKALKESRDELLDSLKILLSKTELTLNTLAAKAYKIVIQRVEALKEKETK